MGSGLSSVERDIAHALARSKSPWTLADWIRWLTTGHVAMAVGDRMHASMVVWPDGSAEVAHIAGEWNDNDARWMARCMRRVCQQRGITFVGIEGRRGWRRFLRMRGIDTRMARRS